MHNIHDAKTNLSKLVEQVMRGEEVVIGKAGKPVAKLVPYTSSPKGRRKGGQWKDVVWIADDFDVLPDDIAAAFGMTDEK